jgi:hypothetical protein
MAQDDDHGEEQLGQTAYYKKVPQRQRQRHDVQNNR